MSPYETGDIFVEPEGQNYGAKTAGGQHVVDPREEWYSLCVSSGLGQWIPAKRKNGEEFKAYRGLGLHDFRRSAIRNMTFPGVSDVMAMKISRHKTASVSSVTTSLTSAISNRLPS
ncbi:MAG TPA: hypothetical protein VGI46_13330 [Candidatus Acidoferrum sp.]|jgi:hypothetical protein